MTFFQTIKSLNPLSKLGPSAAAKVATGLHAGQTLADVMRDASDGVARQAVREALGAFSDGPAALLITCLIESSTAGWERLATQVVASKDLPPEGASWVAARMMRYGESLNSDPMSQHLINLVLSVTGLHVEALIIESGDVEANRLSEKLAELMKQGLSSALSRNDLSQSLVSSSRPSRRVAAPRPSAG